MDFWTFYGYVLPAIIMVGAVFLYLLHEWDLDRKIRRRQQHPGE
ncbi:hypothetical protein SAMN03159496_06246 [Rhizobium sp. NFR07]|nr:hypothetical protein [Rhizobium sp. NFR07]SFB63431.1 hypothetical protein SAMN03159496_06246 [Rhizobium sp. NFR07]